jgi:hypothetical protein
LAFDTGYLLVITSLRRGILSEHKRITRIEI